MPRLDWSSWKITHIFYLIHNLSTPPMYLVNIWRAPRLGTKGVTISILNWNWPKLSHNLELQIKKWDCRCCHTPMSPFCIQTLFWGPHFPLRTACLPPIGKYVYFSESSVTKPGSRFLGVLICLDMQAISVCILEECSV